MSATEKYTLRQLAPLIQQGKKYRLFKPFLYNGQIFLNIEKNSKSTYMKVRTFS